MDNEFPQLEPDPNQKEFLADWWSPKKLLRAERQQGKTTMMLCEARRFSEAGFDVVFMTPRESELKRIKREYQSLFGEQPLFEMVSYNQMKNAYALRGLHSDVVIMDEVQRITLEDINYEVLPMDPMFIRASACKSSMGRVHYLKDQEDGDFFDSVYEFTR